MQFDIVANDKATPAMGKVEKSMDGFGKKLGSSMTMATARAMAALAAIQKVIQVAGELGDISDEAAKLGVSVEMYQRMKFAAEAYGLSVEDIAKGFIKVNNVLDEAATKGGPNAEILKALGFAQEEITNRVIKTEEVYRRLAQAIGAATSEEEKFALASRVFGDRQAQGMVPVLQYFDDFEKKQKSIRVISDQNAAALDDFSEKASGAFADAKALFGGAFGALLSKAGFGAEAPKPEESPADTAAKKARGEQMRKALLNATAKDAGKVSPESLSMAAIGGASAQVLRGVGMKSPEQETAENTRRLVELATAPAPAAGAPTGVSRAFTEGVTDLQKVYQAHPIQYKSVPFRINAPSTR